MPSRGPNVKKFVLNCVPSVGVETDWSFEDAVQAGMVQDTAPPQSTDLREKWWEIRHQGKTGACVGFAIADGVLHWHYRKAGLLSGNQRPSPRFIWMANKETDNLTAYPTTFIEKAGTQTKLALRIARNYGCVLESTLPMNGKLSPLKSSTFYTIAAQYRISSYHNLGRDLGKWRSWIANQGPILTRLDVDRTWMDATKNGGHLNTYKPNTIPPPNGHAVCLVGYDQDSFIVRNSWGKSWGNNGFAYASNDYAAKAFTEAYGAAL